TRERVEKVRSLAGSDPLTGLRNRRGLNERLQAVLVSGGSGTIAVLDCDRFKQVNDTLGHAAGDRALRAIAGGIRAHTREADTAARWGGDEFVIYFADLDPDAAGQVLVRIRDALHQQPAALIDDRPLGFSFGLARLGGAQGHRDSNSAFDAADRDLYRAKQACRGAIPA
ncbi:MAG: GGDEF domain-containing protein, partial [Pseudomonadota bacterium]|nr:GGDEF domain-containing protein [Pseudomonadota bacterium]